MPNLNGIESSAKIAIGEDHRAETPVVGLPGRGLEVLVQLVRPVQELVGIVSLITKPILPLVDSDRKKSVPDGKIDNGADILRRRGKL